MKIQALVATMHQNDYSLLDSLNLQTDAVIVNQCDREGEINLDFHGINVKWINTKERGLSRSRNMALRNSDADICIICDDDETLMDGYSEMVSSAYESLQSADFIAFNINRIGWNEEETLFTTPKKIGRFKTYGSVHVTFRRESIIRNRIVFNELFGAGSGMYTSAEDAIFCMDCHHSGIRMFTYPGVLCDVVCEKSTWFSGYDEKYFFDVGAYLSVAFPKSKHVMKWYYPIRMKKLSSLKWYTIIQHIDTGIKGFEKGLNYEGFCKKNKEK